MNTSYSTVDGRYWLRHFVVEHWQRGIIIFDDAEGLVVINKDQNIFQGGVVLLDDDKELLSSSSTSFSSSAAWLFSLQHFFLSWAFSMLSSLTTNCYLACTLVIICSVRDNLITWKVPVASLLFHCCVFAQFELEIVFGPYMAFLALSTHNHSFFLCPSLGQDIHISAFLVTPPAAATDIVGGNREVIGTAHKAVGAKGTILHC